MLPACPSWLSGTGIALACQHMLSSSTYIIWSPHPHKTVVKGYKQNSSREMYSPIWWHIKNKSRNSLFLQRKMWVPHIKNKTVYIWKRLTLKKYAATHSIAHITTVNKHKHNHHYCHDTSSSLELSSRCQNWYPQLARTGMAVFQLPFPTFRANLSGLLCTETVEATMPMAVEPYRDVTISLLLYGSK